METSAKLEFCRHPGACRDPSSLRIKNLQRNWVPACAGTTSFTEVSKNAAKPAWILRALHRAAKRGSKFQRAQTRKRTRLPADGVGKRNCLGQ
jgi:hypothetical protein